MEPNTAGKIGKTMQINNRFMEHCPSSFPIHDEVVKPLPPSPDAYTYNGLDHQ
jgi:hypothetical protein